MFVTDNHEAKIKGCTPTPWLFYTGIDGEPGRYFKINKDCLGFVKSGYYYPLGYDSAECYPVSPFMVGKVWNENRGLNIPSELKGK